MSTPDDEIRQRILTIFGRIAPEVDWGEVRGDEALRDQVELDSMDLLNVVVAVHDDLGVEVPERDYPKLETLDGFVAYVASARARG